MIKLENAQTANPDGACTLGILIASQALEDAGSELILTAADSAGFVCVVFEANDFHVESLTKSLGEDWTVELEEQDVIRCLKA